jgi:hypothetical protein
MRFNNRTNMTTVTGGELSPAFDDDPTRTTSGIAVVR